MSKKFKLREDLGIDFFGRKLFRIECVEEIKSKNIKVGQLGGYVEKEDNLYDNAWVSGNAKVYDNAWLSDDAWVSGDARVYGNAWVSGDARV